MPSKVPKITDMKLTIKELIKKMRFIVEVLTPIDLRSTISLYFSLIKKI
jgi:hypothetical protein